ncbi:hypothetical protein CspeluHIS016_0106870 [Cutaneotrichosporon spelunceum]|uniref:Topoisomerase I damage affected protein 2 n=1 Tax=Cutaneotrichosporon spelunceum TaxID=1672016 RepID=A0AAD3TNG3_9TREE|nr:hypothetical protein CspeluHIS016_0106870 [Cutaneotrichosporon spelunceum]
MPLLDAIKSRLPRSSSSSTSKTDSNGEYYSRTLRIHIDNLTSLPDSSLMSRPSGTLSPPLRIASPRIKFNADQLRPYVRTTLANAVWDGNDKARMSQYSKDICEKVKSRMLEIEPKGFKYIVTTTFTENLGQAGRADMACHWEDTDAACQEIFSNDGIIFVCIAYAIRVI